jgi:hypothetical protein
VFFRKVRKTISNFPLSVFPFGEKCRILISFGRILTSGSVGAQKNSSPQQAAVSALVGMTRLELATTRPPDAYANQLRHIPKKRVSFR